MVAYSFAPMFREPVAQLVKRQTVRAHRRRHARPGEAVQLYTAMRTKHCRKLVAVDPICTHVRPIRIRIGISGIRLSGMDIVLDGDPLSINELECFALADGFDRTLLRPAWVAMAGFWLQRHGEKPFEGVVIEWEPRS